MRFYNNSRTVQISWGGGGGGGGRGSLGRGDQGRI